MTALDGSAEGTAVTGPVLRAAGLPWDLRKTEPYLGYQSYDFEVPTADTSDAEHRDVTARQLFYGSRTEKHFRSFKYIHM